MGDRSGGTCMAVPLVITAERQKLLFLTSYLNQITN